MKKKMLGTTYGNMLGKGYFGDQTKESRYLMGTKENIVGNNIEEEIELYKQLTDLYRHPDENSMKVVWGTIEGVSTTWGPKSLLVSGIKILRKFSKKFG